MKKHFSTWIGAILALLLLWMFFSTLDWRELWGSFKQASPSLLVAGFIGGALTFVFRAFRWLILLRTLKEDVPFREAFWATMVGFGANSVLPGRVGEILRAVWIRSTCRIPVGHVLASVVVERLVDVLVSVSMFTFYLVGSRWIPLFSQVSEKQRFIVHAIGRYGLFATITLLVGIFLFVIWARRFEKRIHETNAKGMGKLHFFIHQIAQGFSIIHSWRTFAAYLFVSYVFWLFTASVIWLEIIPFVHNFPVYGAPWVTLLVMMGATIPTPGGTGGFDWGLRIGVTLFYGAAVEPASAAALWSHACLVFPALFFSAPYLFLKGLPISFSELKNFEKEFTLHLQESSSIEVQDEMSEMSS